MPQLSKKMHFSGFLFTRVVQKHKLGEVGKKYILITYFLSNTSAKIIVIKPFMSRLQHVKGGTFFETRCIYCGDVRQGWFQRCHCA